MRGRRAKLHPETPQQLLSVFVVVVGIATFCESFNARLRDKFLKGEILYWLPVAAQALTLHMHQSDEAIQISLSSRDVFKLNRTAALTEWRQLCAA